MRWQESGYWRGNDQTRGSAVQFCLRAFNSRGAGPWSNVVSTTATIEGSPHPCTRKGSLWRELMIANDITSRNGVGANARALLAHEDEGYEEWGASGHPRVNASSSGRGLSASLTPVWGAAGSGAEQLYGMEHTGGRAEGRKFEAESRVEAELGYGLSTPAPTDSAASSAILRSKQIA